MNTTAITNQIKLHQKAIYLLGMIAQNDKMLQHKRNFLLEFNNEKDSLAIIRIRNTREGIISEINATKDAGKILLDTYTDTLAELAPVLLEEQQPNPQLNPVFESILYNYA